MNGIVIICKYTGHCYQYHSAGHDDNKKLHYNFPIIFTMNIIYNKLCYAYQSGQ